MKHIYWCIPQLNKIGGTETVSIDLMNHLCRYYDITLICTCRASKPYVYKLDPAIKVLSLDLPDKLLRYDQFSLLFLTHLRLISFLGLNFSFIFYYLFRRRSIRKRLGSLLDSPDSVLIASSLDSYWFAPENGTVFFHFHFSERIFLKDFANNLVLRHTRRPDKYIFLSRSILEAVCKARPQLRRKALYIYNPIRFAPKLDLSYHGNTIIFAGRYSSQKNPLLALRVARTLRDRGFKFKLKMFGQGSLEDKMRLFVRLNGLESVVEINRTTLDIRKEIAAADLLLITSVYEGFILVRGEAAALSRPAVSSDWGDTVYEMFRDGKDGYIVCSDKPEAYADRIMEILSDPENLKSMKKAAFEYSHSLSYDMIIPQWARLIS